MRKVEYLSPSALACYESDPIEYFIRYLSSVRAPRFPQTAPMSVGSAFDAFCKSYIHGALFGKDHKDSGKYQFTNIFESQVEPHNRDFAHGAGEYCFKQYMESGALADLMGELQTASDEPRFEFDLKGEVHGYREGVTAKKMGVVLMGKPDVRFINSEGAHVIYDWKVNGYCGKGNTSPTPGYVQLRECSQNYWRRMGPHKDAFISKFKGTFINAGMFLESVKEDWATQLSTYAWLLGEPVGSETVIGIDQIVGKNIGGIRPELRIATHRTRVSERFQFEAIARYQHLWSLLNDEPFYFFRDRSFEDSKKFCELLEKRIETCLKDDLTSDEAWVMSLAKEESFYGH